MALPTIRKHRKRREAIAAGNDAAARLRREMRKSVMVVCARCPARVFASAADVDHIVPLAKGGQDIDSNVQILCRPCHKAKTRVDFDFQNTPF
jgi:5-methylcytosine-specific restriction protein A